MNRLTVVAAAAALGASGWMWWRASSIRGATPAENASASREAELRVQLDEARKEIEALRATHLVSPPPPVASDRRTAQTHPAASGVPAPPVDLRRALEEKESFLAAQAKTLQELRDKITEIERAAREARERQEEAMRRQQADLQQEVDASVRRTGQLQAELELQNRRVRELEVASQDTRRRMEESARRAARAKQISSEMDSLTRRREGYMNTILGRYREATDLLRTMSLRGEGSDLSRIQSAIALAEEDLRQLRELQSRSSRLQKDFLENLR